MVWAVEKKIMRYVLDLCFERTEIPVRVKFEYEVKEGRVVSGSISKEILYNQKAIVNRYPNVKLDSLDKRIEEWVEGRITATLDRRGYLTGKSDQTP